VCVVGVGFFVLSGLGLCVWGWVLVLGVVLRGLESVFVFWLGVEGLGVLSARSFSAKIFGKISTFPPSPGPFLPRFFF